MNDEKDNASSNTMNRRKFLNASARNALVFTAGVATTITVQQTTTRETVWQIDPDVCVQCESCRDNCVLSPSAVKCVQSYPLCGYCELCFGYFRPDAKNLTSAAENQLCPTGAIERVFVEDPYWEYNIIEELCVGCAKCVRACEVFGNASFYLQVRHDVCVNCNECSIARACPVDAFKRVPASSPYLLRKPVLTEPQS